LSAPLTTSVRPWALAGLLGLGAAAVFTVWSPPEEARYSICLTRRTTGMPCPACGMTRALAHLAKGEWAQAWAAHPMAPILGAQALLAWLYWGLAAWRGRTPSAPAWLSAVVIGNAALLGVIWLIRLATGTVPY
jgi:hypothetical protein